jgi:hypothetical protein
MGSAKGVLSRVALWIPPALTAIVALGWAGLTWLYCETALVLGDWPRPKADDPKDSLPELQYQFGWYFVAALVFGSLAILIVLAALAAADQKGNRTAKLVAFATAILSLLMAYMGPWVSWYLD